MKSNIAWLRKIHLEIVRFAIYFCYALFCRHSPAIASTLSISHNSEIGSRTEEKKESGEKCARDREKSILMTFLYRDTNDENEK